MLCVVCKAASIDRSLVVGSASNSEGDAAGIG